LVTGMRAPSGFVLDKSAMPLLKSHAAARFRARLVNFYTAALATDIHIDQRSPVEERFMRPFQR